MDAARPNLSPRVVSLLPSATETLCRIGGSGLLVGRSHECDFPTNILDRPVLTGQITDSGDPAAIDRAVAEAVAAGRPLYTLDAPLLSSLRPDVILTQDLCRVCSIDLQTVEQVAAAMTPRPAVVSLNPRSFEGVLDDVLTVGRAVGLERETREELVRLRERFHRAADYVTPYTDGPSVAFLEWSDPLYIGGHWTPQLIERAGGRHPLNPTAPLPGAGSGEGGQGAHRVAGKSRRVTPEELVRSKPDAVIVCPCGIALPGAREMALALEREPWWRELPAARRGKVALVDGNQMFNRPGPRLVDAFEWIVGWLNDRPELTPRDFPWQAAPPRR